MMRILYKFSANTYIYTPRWCTKRKEQTQLMEYLEDFLVNQSEDLIKNKAEYKKRNT